MSKNRSQRALGNFRKRKNFARIPTVIDIPNLIEIQKKSFEYFLQWDVDPNKREFRGLEEVFSDVFPISDLNINAPNKRQRFLSGKFVRQRPTWRACN